MPSRIEDYALIGDCETCALVAKDGSIDWLCVPRFDSGACFAALLGKPEHGRWLLAPHRTEVRSVRRRYRPGTLVLETTFETDSGAATVIDFMPVRTREPILVRVVQGERGQVPMRSEFILRFDYGSIVPWVRKAPGGIQAIAGPDAVVLRAGVPMRGEDFTTVADFVVSAGQREAFTFNYFSSVSRLPEAVDAGRALADAERWWKEWSGRCTYDGPYGDTVVRSLVTLKALTYAPTGGILAAATTSLPEQLGGPRNWDYRYCWLRDATFTLLALLNGGYVDEAKAWGDWLLRAAAGRPADLQILYGLAGERRLTEIELPWLPGYEDSRPVRVGNAASQQFQLDVYGEVLDALYQCQRHGIRAPVGEIRLEDALADFLVTAWDRPDRSMWEVRGPERPFTHSKVMAWVAFDRLVKSAEQSNVSGPVDRWRALRRQIHDEVCRHGYDEELGSFVQFYGGKELDASLLMIPLVGFLPASDRRVRGTVEAVQKHLMRDGLVLRYHSKPEIDGLPPGEGVFLACSFWLADSLTLLGRQDEARALFERLLGLCNDVGLLSEEYDPHRRRMVGNFPQAFSHVGILNTAYNLSKAGGPARQRGKG